MAEVEKVWISVAEAQLMQELMRIQEAEMIGEFTQFGFEKRFNLPYPGKDNTIKTDKWQK